MVFEEDPFSRARQQQQQYRQQRQQQNSSNDISALLQQAVFLLVGMMLVLGFFAQAEPQGDPTPGPQQTPQAPRSYKPATTTTPAESAHRPSDVALVHPPHPVQQRHAPSLTPFIRRAAYRRGWRVCVWVPRGDLGAEATWAQLEAVAAKFAHDRLTWTYVSVGKA